MSQTTYRHISADENMQIAAQIINRQGHIIMSCSNPYEIGDSMMLTTAIDNCEDVEHPVVVVAIATREEFVAQLHFVRTLDPTMPDHPHPSRPYFYKCATD